MGVLGEEEVAVPVAIVIEWMARRRTFWGVMMKEIALV